MRFRIKVNDEAYYSKVSTESAPEEGHYEAEVELKASPELLELSTKLFGKPEILEDVLLNFDFPFTVEYMNLDDSESWYADGDAYTWFLDDQGYLDDSIMDTLEFYGINYSKESLEPHMAEIKKVMQDSANACDTNIVYATQKWVPSL